VNAIGCPFMSYRPGQSLLPDDACRPNIIGRDDGAVNGYADPGEIGLGDVEVDLPSAVWTCQYNLAPRLGQPFLRAQVRRLWARYATTGGAPGRLRP
jgi:aminoglycoside phosphotransferase